MFVQIHILQSMPPGNLNRDDSGQPKHCLFGGVTRARISSQCLKRNIRLSPQFKDAFGSALADRTKYLPRMVADVLRNDKTLGIPEEDLAALTTAIAQRFKSEEKKEPSEDESDASASTSSAAQHGGGETNTTGQLVFFPQPFAREIAEITSRLASSNKAAYEVLLGRTKLPKPTKKGSKETQSEQEIAKVKAINRALEIFQEDVTRASKSLTVDIGLFGRMTTSDLVVNVEASCQVAHAISTHEVLIESDYFTAMDDRKADFAKTQTELAGAAFLGSGDTETFFNSAVYYKYLNLDLSSFRKHLPSLDKNEAAKVVATLIEAAALSNPTGKQNSFAAHGAPQFILVELTQKRIPISYANAFLQPIEGGAGKDQMRESANAIRAYIDSVASAFQPADLKRVHLAVGAAEGEVRDSVAAKTLHELLKTVTTAVTKPAGHAP